MLSVLGTYLCNLTPLNIPLMFSHYLQRVGTPRINRGRSIVVDGLITAIAEQFHVTNFMSQNLSSDNTYKMLIGLGWMEFTLFRKRNSTILPKPKAYRK